MDAILYPLIIWTHLSDPSAHARSEIAADFVGAGIGVEFPRAGISVEGAYGVKRLTCPNQPMCGPEGTAQLTVTWRGGRGRR